ncbi:MAG: hypothetical protein ACJ0QL_03915 [Parvicellaceae bacterium]
MDTREFDDLVKSSLSDFSQLPKKEVRRAVFGIIFFQNLWIFHKVKLFSAILFISTFSLYAVYSDDSLEPQLVEDQLKAPKSERSLSEIQNSSAVLSNVIADQSESELPESNTLTAYSKADKSIVSSSPISIENDAEQSAFDNENDIKVKQQTVTQKKSLDLTVNTPIKTTSLKVNNNLAVNESSNPITSKGLVQENYVDADLISEMNSNKSAKSAISAINESESDELNNLDKVPTKTITAIHLCEDPIEIQSVPIVQASDYANDKFKRGFSVDAYFSPYSRADIDNVLADDYQEYWWDFYKEYDMQKSGVSMGLNLSYNYRNFKVNSGFSHHQIMDYKPVYNYYTETDSIFIYSSMGELSLLSVEYISGLQVYGQDTAVILYVDPNDTQLSQEISQSANRYNYLKIPLTLGYELSFDRFSFELNAGIEYSRLVKSSGISYKQGYVDVGIRPYPYYYYNDMVATTYSNNAGALKINNWNYVANVVSRIRLTPSFDFYSAFNYQHHNQNIMSDTYLLQKTYKKYSVNLGLTYYLNPRLSLKNTEIPKFN